MEKHNPLLSLFLLLNDPNESLTDRFYNLQNPEEWDKFNQDLKKIRRIKLFT